MAPGNAKAASVGACVAPQKRVAETGTTVPAPLGNSAESGVHPVQGLILLDLCNLMAAKESAGRAQQSFRVEEISALLVCLPVLRRQVMRRFSCAILFASICVVVAAQQLSTPANLHFNGRTWWEKVKVIADDKMEGR